MARKTTSYRCISYSYVSLRIALASSTEISFSYTKNEWNTSSHNGYSYDLFCPMKRGNCSVPEGRQRYTLHLKRFQATIILWTCDVSSFVLVAMSCAAFASTALLWMNVLIKGKKEIVGHKFSHTFSAVFAWGSGQNFVCLESFQLCTTRVIRREPC